VHGRVSGAYGVAIHPDRHAVPLLAAGRHLKVDSREVVIDQADFKVIDGLVAAGPGSGNLTSVQHPYHVHFDLPAREGGHALHPDLILNQFNEVSISASVDVSIPSWVPFIGGDTLGSLEGYLYIDPVVPSNDIVAAWIDINTYIFGHFRLGAEFFFY